MFFGCVCVFVDKYICVERMNVHVWFMLIQFQKYEAGELKILASYAEDTEPESPSRLLYIYFKGGPIRKMLSSPRP